MITYRSDLGTKATFHLMKSVFAVIMIWRSIFIDYWNQYCNNLTNIYGNQDQWKHKCQHKCLINI